MRISILTPSYNQGKFIEKTITSVMNQNWQDVEHIIIDGGSTDNTIDILKRYPHLRWISEPDEGQADALNKGLEVATGEIIGWINSDDYYEINIFEDVVSYCRDIKVKWIIGNITFHYTTQQVKIPCVSPDITYAHLLRNPDIVRQQGTFFRKELLKEVGGWGKDFYMVMDYDLWVRIAKKYQPKMVNKNFAYFAWHTEQKSSPKNMIRQAREINQILKDNKVPLIKRLPVLSKKYYYLVKSILKDRLIATGFISEKYSSMPMSAIKNKK